MEAKEQRAFVMDYLSNRVAAPKYHWLYIIAIENDEQRYFDKIRLKENILFRSDGVAWIARPDGYQHIYQHKHFHDGIWKTSVDDVLKMPKAQGEPSKYEGVLKRVVSCYNLEFKQNRSQSPMQQQLFAERQESAAADSAAGAACYEYWLKVHRHDYNEAYMNSQWNLYNAYRAKYNLPPMELYPD